MTQPHSGAVRVGIQGVRASFHDVAARKHFSGQVVQPVECASFKLLAEVLLDGRADFCLMAIENSIAGSILTNYALMESNGFKILGEVYLRIEMSIMALPGQKLEQLKVVQSHPMALLQCTEFLSDYPNLKVIEASDTAESAKIIADKQLRGYAAIASALAAREYGLELLKQGIESNRLNYTRFLVICRNADYRRPVDANKTSICFEAADQPGSLVEVLEVFKSHGINMTKIQSVPILGRPYEYSFHADLEWEPSANYDQALAIAKSKVKKLVHFGDYHRGNRMVSL